MAARSPLRLLVDPPYTGESLSSFLGRAAQAYCMPTSELLCQLMQGISWQNGRRDLDRWPPDGLLSVLSEVVRDWQSPSSAFVGFNRWVLSPKYRASYCPACFLEDLASDRVPHFRQDWIAVLVTSCWKHGTPLCHWRWVTRTGIRRLPKEWVFKSPKRECSYPTFFVDDLHRTEKLDFSAKSNHLGESLECRLGLLRRLQSLLEKRASDPLPLNQDDQIVHLNSWANELCHMGVGYVQGSQSEGPLASCLLPKLDNEWFGAPPACVRPRHHEYWSYALRLDGDVSWRRTCLWFAARTLAACEPCASSMFADFQPLQHWERWWASEVRPNCHVGFHRDLDAIGEILKLCGVGPVHFGAVCVQEDR